MLKYWKFEDAALKELLRNLSVGEIARTFFDNETQAYRFARALMLVKQKGSLRLKECPNDLPLATWKRYLDYGVTVGILKHENETYSFTNRFLSAFKNFGNYIQEWIEKGNPNEDLAVVFPRAKTTKYNRQSSQQQSGAQQNSSNQTNQQDATQESQ